MWVLPEPFLILTCMEVLFACFQIIHPDRHCLEKLVLVPEWNYVPVSSSSTAKPTKSGKVKCVKAAKGNL